MVYRNKMIQLLDKACVCRRYAVSSHTGVITSLIQGGLYFSMVYYLNGLIIKYVLINCYINCKQTCFCFGHLGYNILSPDKNFSKYL